MDGSGFRAKVQGLIGAQYVVTASADLVQWQPAGQVRIEGYEPTAEFALPGNASTRFIRLHTPEP
jgi:hypothetical protein